MKKILFILLLLPSTAFAITQTLPLSSDGSLPITDNSSSLTIDCATTTAKVSAFITDGTYVAQVDNVTDTLQTIEYEHHEIHDGDIANVSYRWNELTDDGYAVFHFKTGANKAHLVINACANGLAYIDVYRGPTLSDDGTELQLINREISTSTSSFTSDAFYTPTVTSSGTLIAQDLIPGGTDRKVGGSATSSRGEFVLPINSSVLIIVQNKKGSVSDTCMVADWYEKAP